MIHNKTSNNDQEHEALNRVKGRNDSTDDTESSTDDSTDDSTDTDDDTSSDDEPDEGTTEEDSTTDEEDSDETEDGGQGDTTTGDLIQNFGKNLNGNPFMPRPPNNMNNGNNLSLNAPGLGDKLAKSSNRSPKSKSKSKKSPRKSPKKSPRKTPRKNKRDHNGHSKGIISDENDEDLMDDIVNANKKSKKGHKRNRKDKDDMTNLNLDDIEKEVNINRNSNITMSESTLKTEIDMNVNNEIYEDIKALKQAKPRYNYKGIGMGFKHVADDSDNMQSMEYNYDNVNRALQNEVNVDINHDQDDDDYED